MLRNLREELVVDESEQGLKLEFRPTAKFDGSIIREPTRVRGSESNSPASSALVDQAYAFKLFRKLETGIHPAIEIGRFLTDAGFANAPNLLGTAELIEPDGNRCAVATLHAEIQNQGDAWAVTSGYLDRFIEEQRLIHDGDNEKHAPHRPVIALIGTRLAELHLALAAGPAGSDFTPAPVTAADMQQRAGEIIASADAALDILRARRDSLKEADKPLVEAVSRQGDRSCRSFWKHSCGATTT